MSNRRTVAPKSDSEDIIRIEKVIEIIYKDLLNEGGRFKVSELIKAIELKRKLAPTDDRERQFWNMINGIRQDTLAKQNEPNAKRNGGKRDSGATPPAE